MLLPHCTQFRSQVCSSTELAVRGRAVGYRHAIKQGIWSVDDDSIITVDVREHNFEEARRISELIMSNFKKIGFLARRCPAIVELVFQLFTISYS
jgi:hypothetical protein